MSSVSVREFSYNPSAIFSRVERGESIEVTRHGNPIAVLLPSGGVWGRYSELVAKGAIRLKSATNLDIDRFRTYNYTSEIDPLDVLLAERAEDDR
ncbi:type II toxin-antitoxin system prevent-host-death family antitoxin [Spiractinospora alimapuensis]|uniref:type II toxin-antitoxin system Phd/YefM family antitoxin n=1 Tax=Spiractinospora alimapuensis TaxID=2820884 RepID=UPI001F1EC652|nr:type II toxin-antitoxin system prevent-host-death family antitoxin [Spiractinospora alimapuensis]QVQ52599.1 type II toxin-antitoxin system prevent-host-death family antitoxin [Spiractinospora alimapuensis]